MKILFLILIGVYYAVAVLNIEIEIQTRNETEMVGNSLILTDKYPNLTNFAPGISERAYTLCAKGSWAAYYLVNYTTYYSGDTQFITEGCISSTAAVQSVRYLGPRSSETPSITFYSNTYIRGEEVVITTPAYSFIPFRPLSLFSSGWSNWTIYSGSNFNGTTFCYVSNSEKVRVENINTTISARIASVIQGCDSKTDKYIYASDVVNDLYYLE